MTPIASEHEIFVRIIQFRICGEKSGISNASIRRAGFDGANSGKKGPRRQVGVARQLEVKYRSDQFFHLDIRMSFTRDNER